MLTSLSKFYGRDKEKALIMQAYHQNLHLNPAKPSYLIIHGDEGMGKTYIVEALLCNQVRVSDCGFFVVWNFPCQHPNFDVTFEASDGLDDVIISLLHQIMIAGDTIVQEIKESFMQEMEIKDRTFLVQMIPQFSTLLGSTIEQSSLMFNYSINLRAPELRMRTLLQVLRIVSKPNRPIVLFMDNVEYANENNRRLIESLIQETAIQRIFYVIAIGPNKSNAIQNFLQSIQNIPANVRTAVKIQLPPLGATVTHSMVADILQTDMDSIEPLHSFLQPRIKGNPRFLISWLSWLYSNDYLQWNTATQAWSWDTDQFLVHNDDKNTSRTTWDDLPKSIQYFLQVSSCIGNKVSMIYLESIFEKPTKSYLFDAVKHWWALPFTTQNQLDDNEECCVLSKSVREFAFSTIPKDSQEEFHLTIGRNLWSGLVERDSLDDFPEHQSLIVTQMLLGENVMTDPNERTATASLCLSIAKESIAMSQFSSAAIFLDRGIHLLSDWCWREEYDLTIALYNISAEVSYILGDFETVQLRCHAIFHNAQLVDHTFPACSVQISILSAAGNTDEALRVGLDVLERIGEPIVARPSKLQIARSFLQLRRLSRNITPNKMRQLPLMSNPRKAAAMLIINHMIMPAHFGRECLTFFLMNRLIHLTVQHGLCNVSSVAFGWFAVILATTGQTRLGSQFAELALELLHRFESKQWLSRVHLCVFGGVFGWTQNIRNSLVPLSRGFEVGIETGDIEYAFLNATLKIVYEFNLGRKLSDLLLECEKIVEPAIALKHIWPVFSQRAMIYLIQGLINKDYSEAMDLLDQEQRNADVPSASSFLNYMTGWRLILSYIMSDYDQALIEASAIEHLDRRQYPEIDLCLIITIDALSRLERCPCKGWQRRKTLSIVRKRIVILQRFSNANPELCLGMLDLVLARVAQTKGNVSEAIRYYQRSISQLDKEKLLSVHPIACEQAARLILSCKREEEEVAAHQYLEESLKLYHQWGAQQKCRLLQNEMELLFTRGLWTSGK